MQTLEVDSEWETVRGPYSGGGMGKPVTSYTPKTVPFPWSLDEIKRTVIEARCLFGVVA